MCLKINKSNIGKHSKRKYVYKFVLGGLVEGAFSNFFSNALSTKFVIGQKVKSNRKSRELNLHEKFVGEVEYGFHTFITISDLKAYLKEQMISGVFTIKCTVDPKDHVIDGTFNCGGREAYASAVYMSITPVSVFRAYPRKK